MLSVHGGKTRVIRFGDVQTCHIHLFIVVQSSEDFILCKFTGTPST